MPTIESIAVEELSTPLSSPFVISLGEQHELANVVLVVELSDGTRGFGEAAPVPHITGETQGTALAACRSARELLVGEPIADYRGLVETLAESFSAQHSARAGLEIALFDARCRSFDCSLSEFVGGRGQSIQTDITVSIIDPESARDRAKDAVDAGFTTIKVKVGESLSDDTDRVAAVADAAPDAAITIDANQGYSPKETLRFVDRLDDRGLSIDLLEQPVPRADLAGLKRVRDAVRIPVAADESVYSPTDAQRVIERGAADVINVKLMKSGVLGALDIVSLAQASDIKLMIGCMLESSIGIHTAAHIVAGTGAFDYVDLDGNFSLETDFGETTDGPAVPISGPGHGVVPDAVDW